MSVNYATGLSHYPDKGKCGLPEILESEKLVEEKIQELTKLIKSSKHFVVFTGAGISTSIGIPDFRGVWTLEEKGESVPISNVTFNNAIPSQTHIALKKLEEAGHLKFLVTQNVDGLHLRSGYPRNRMSILHGDMFIDECVKCGTQYVRRNAAVTMGRKSTGDFCYKTKAMGKCRGKLHDTILDWEDELPRVDLELAQKHCREADLIMCLGTSLQIEPAGSLPITNLRRAKKRSHNLQSVQKKPDLVIVNIQTTKQDKYASLRIFQRTDYVMSKVCSLLKLPLEQLGPDSTMPLPIVLKSRHTSNRERFPWTIVLANDVEAATARLSDDQHETDSPGPVVLTVAACDTDAVFINDLSVSSTFLNETTENSPQNCSTDQEIIQESNTTTDASCLAIEMKH